MAERYRFPASWSTDCWWEVWWDRALASFRAELLVDGDREPLAQLGNYTSAELIRFEKLVAAMVAEDPCLEVPTEIEEDLLYDRKWHLGRLSDQELQELLASVGRQRRETGSSIAGLQSAEGGRG